MKLRQEVKEFAQAMERELRNNAHKGGWENCTSEYLWLRVNSELGELADVLSHGNTDAQKKKYLAEAADVANFLMMLCDINDCLRE